MFLKEYIAETRYTDYGPIVRTCTRPVRLTDWFPVIRLFLGIVWRKWDIGYRIAAATAWDVAMGVHDIKKVPIENSSTSSLEQTS